MADSIFDTLKKKQQESFLRRLQPKPTIGPDTQSEFSKGLASATLATEANLRAFGANIAENFAPEWAKSQLDEIKTLAKAAQDTAPSVTDLRQIQSLSDVGKFAAGSLGQALPTIGTALVGSRLGVAGLRAAGVQTTPLAAGIAGGAAGVFPQEAGEAALSMYTDPEAMQRTTPEERTAIMLGKGAAGSVLEALVPAMAGEKIFGKSLRPKTPIAPGLVPAAAHVGKEALKTGGIEGATEAAQAQVGQIARHIADPSEDLLAGPWETATAFAHGLIPGKALGAVAAVPETVAANIQSTTPARLSDIIAKANRGEISGQELAQQTYEKGKEAGTRAGQAFVRISDLVKNRINELRTTKQSQVRAAQDFDETDNQILEVLKPVLSTDVDNRQAYLALRNALLTDTPLPLSSMNLFQTGKEKQGLRALTNLLIRSGKLPYEAKDVAESTHKEATKWATAIIRNLKTEHGVPSSQDLYEAADLIKQELSKDSKILPKILNDLFGANAPRFLETIEEAGLLPEPTLKSTLGQPGSIKEATLFDVESDEASDEEAFVSPYEGDVKIQEVETPSTWRWRSEKDKDFYDLRNEDHKKYLRDNAEKISKTGKKFFVVGAVDYGRRTGDKEPVREIMRKNKEIIQQIRKEKGTKAALDWVNENFKILEVYQPEQPLDEQLSWEELKDWRDDVGTLRFYGPKIPGKVFRTTPNAITMAVRRKTRDEVGEKTGAERTLRDFSRALAMMLSVKKNGEYAFNKVTVVDKNGKEHTLISSDPKERILGTRQLLGYRIFKDVTIRDALKQLKRSLEFGGYQSPSKSPKENQLIVEERKFNIPLDQPEGSIVSKETVITNKIYNVVGSFLTEKEALENAGPKDRIRKIKGKWVVETPIGFETQEISELQPEIESFGEYKKPDYIKEEDLTPGDVEAFNLGPRIFDETTGLPLHPGGFHPAKESRAALLSKAHNIAKEAASVLKGSSLSAFNHGIDQLIDYLSTETPEALKKAQGLYQTLRRHLDLELQPKKSKDIIPVNLQKKAERIFEEELNKSKQQKDPYKEIREKLYSTLNDMTLTAARTMDKSKYALFLEGIDILRALIGKHILYSKDVDQTIAMLTEIYESLKKGKEQAINQLNTETLSKEKTEKNLSTKSVKLDLQELNLLQELESSKSEATQKTQEEIEIDNKIQKNLLIKLNELNLQGLNLLQNLDLSKSDYTQKVDDLNKKTRIIFNQISKGEFETAKISLEGLSHYLHSLSQNKDRRFSKQKDIRTAFAVINEAASAEDTEQGRMLLAEAHHLIEKAEASDQQKWVARSKLKRAEDKLRTKALMEDAAKHERELLNEENLSKEKIGPQPMTPQEQQEIEQWLNEVAPQAVVQFVKSIQGGYSGEWSIDRTTGERIIKVSLYATQPYSTAYHEALHDLFETLRQNGNKEAIRILETVATSPLIQRRLSLLLDGEPDAQAQLSDPEEAAAYMFQFYTVGLLPGLGPKTTGFFNKLWWSIKNTLGWLSDQDKAALLMQYFYDGKLSDPVAFKNIMEKIEMDATPYDPILKPVKQLTKKLFYTADYRLRTSKYPAFRKLANSFAIDPTNKDRNTFYKSDEIDNIGYFNAVMQMTNKGLADLDTMIQGVEKTELDEALTYLQSGTDLNQIPNGPAKLVVKNTRELLRKYWRYLNHAGVPVGQIKDYFPRVWSVETLQSRGHEFVQDLVTHHASQLGPDPQKTAEAILNMMLQKMGVEEPLPKYLGFTPLMESINKRKLNFLDMNVFNKYLEKDYVLTMSRYINHAVKKAEYTRRFGPDGERILEAEIRATIDEVMDILKERYGQAAAKTYAKYRATKLLDAEMTKIEPNWSNVKKEIVDLAKQKVKEEGAIIQAMEGTLGNDISPVLRDVNSWIITYQNIRLLGLSLFASFADPLGIMIRGGEAKHAYRAFVNGMKEVYKTWKGQPTVYGNPDVELVRHLGLLEASSLMDTLGQMYSSQYMNEKAKRINDMLFHFNGMEAWNRATRAQAAIAAIDWLKKAKDSTDPNILRQLEELGLTQDDIVIDANGRLKMPHKVQQAIVTWTNTAILRPNAAQRPVWASNPKTALFFHLMQFTYSFHKAILERVVHEGKHENYGPLAVLIAGYVPITMAALIAKALVQGGGDEPEWMKNMSLADFVSYSILRSGILGIPGAVYETNVSTDLIPGDAPLPLDAAIGLYMPAPAVDQLLRIISPAYNTELDDAIISAMPLQNVWKNWVM